MMIDKVQLVALAVSIVLLGTVLELVRRRRLIEEYSFLWISFSVILLVLSSRREILHSLAGWLGVYYPPIILVMLLIVMFSVASLWHSVVVSRHRRQIERLMEETAILSAELRDLREDHPRLHTRRGRASHDVRARTEPAGHVIADATPDRAESRR
jgi:hypothetical protein